MFVVKRVFEPGKGVFEPVFSENVKRFEVKRGKWYVNMFVVKKVFEPVMRVCEPVKRVCEPGYVNRFVLKRVNSNPGGTYQNVIRQMFNILALMPFKPTGSLGENWIESVVVNNAPYNGSHVR
ncbi:hypothetical protein DPMN_127131 [Dreissena polymorpha]|uniref:Uncharacterized protein n=1 Tax=Dreissena polymorpha TaxID=45954 RepID=A0A9D4H4N6_DREPO|nr:hypothetical protein DPMN_127131 [Dreissena polymorpha]